ncbi:protein translocase subunit SecF [Ruicaihuangia caeni]|uniref:protein translocase subunit SecF n=1 Tax=Ruicaihuangia caeni TaxID=3042517 RepID=UPI00338EA2D1
MAKLTDFGNDLYTGARSIDFVGRRKLWYTIAGVAILLSILVPILRGGFVFGIEFTGGSEFQLSNVAQPDEQRAQDAVTEAVPAAEPRVTIVGADGIRVQTDQLERTESDQVRDSLAAAFDVDPSQVTANFIGPSWGQDITQQAIRGLIIFIVLAAAFMALYFRTWKMSLAALSALAHDLIITIGVYGMLGFEITPAAVIGFLTILGYSLYDTVVVFDKIRENTGETTEGSNRTFAQAVNLAVNQTLVRSINTSVVAALPVASILFIGAVVLGAGTLRDIALALFIGILVGAYSTIFIAAPVYVHLRENEPEVKKMGSKAKKKVVQGAVR